MNPSLALTAPADLLSVTTWRPGQTPSDLGRDQSVDSGVIRWFDLKSDGDTEELFAFLRPLCDELTEEMVEDLLAPDSLPQGKRWSDDQVRLASTFAVYPTKSKTESGGWSCPV